MQNMFINYDNNIKARLDRCPVPPPCIHGPRSASNSAFLYNLKGEALGVEVRGRMPFTLYFNLQSPQQLYLLERLATCAVSFTLVAPQHKAAFEKTFKFSDIYNSMTGDLMIQLTQEEANSLKSETYRIILTLIGDTSNYVLFNETDGLLCIR